MDLTRGDVVRSLAGRDKGRLFFVLACDGQYAILADGRMRKLETPKRKKLRHVQAVSRPGTPVAEKLLSGDRVLNSELRKELAILGQDSQNQGG